MTHKEYNEYNGWTNYETWNANLWLDNDEGSYDFCREIAQEAYDNADSDDTFTREENATLDLSEKIKGLFEDNEEIPTSGWMSDAINCYISEVNWHEIASQYIEDVEKEEEESEEVGQ